jgi:hypothetical protein
VLSGHRRYAHITALRADTVNPPLLGMSRMLSEDAIRRAFEKIEAAAGVDWLREQLDYPTSRHASAFVAVQKRSHAVVRYCAPARHIHRPD